MGSHDRMDSAGGWMVLQGKNRAIRGGRFALGLQGVFPRNVEDFLKGVVKDREWVMASMKELNHIKRLGAEISVVRAEAA